MNILVIGGSYFLGKCFVLQTYKKHNITVFNRGTAPLTIEGVTEITGDRHAPESLEKLCEYAEILHFDVVVDFCAYESGDISAVCEALKGKFSQYIFISTVDVYKRDLNILLDENSAFETRDLGGQEGAYILGKIALEKELPECAVKYGFNYTVIRPAILYGPGNYAPREGIYFYWVENAGQILHPSDADGEFQMVYVEDAASIGKAVCGNEASYNQAYNLTGPGMVDYNCFADALEKAVGMPVTRVEVPVQVILEKSIPLPFPLTKAESNWYNGNKVLQFTDAYTSLEEGLRRTVKAMQKD